MCVCVCERVRKEPRDGVCVGTSILTLVLLLVLHAKFRPVLLSPLIPRVKLWGPVWFVCANRNAQTGGTVRLPPLAGERCLRAKCFAGSRLIR